MPSTNGHSPKTAILYARVSTEEQARSGYSLAQQIEALKAYAARESFESLGEVTDPGQSGASLERPGMDRVRDLVAAGGVAMVLAQDADRITRDPIHRAFLDEEMERFGTQLVALDDWGDNSHEGELLRYMKGWVSKGERLKTAERMRRGKLQKVREGKLVASGAPNYGFRYNATRDGYEVDEDAMKTVRRIFRMVGVERRTLHDVCGTLRREGVPTPGGRKLWSPTFVRNVVKNDVYRAHAPEEVREVVTEQVASALDPEGRYGLWWYNKYRIQSRQTTKSGPDGRQYRRKKTTTQKPKDEWIAVPVPDAGVPREWVEAAREIISNNRKPSFNGRRFWELSGGIAWCGMCRARLETSSVQARNKVDRHFYYRCWRRQKFGSDGCPHPSNYPAHKIESAVWEFVSGLLKDPERLQAGIDEMIERERKILRGDPDQQAKAWAEKLDEVNRQRARAQDGYLAGAFEIDELRAKLAALEEIQETARREIEALSRRRERIEELERDRDTLLGYYARLVPEKLDALAPEKRHRVYKLLQLRVELRPDAEPVISGVFTDALGV